MAKGEQSILLVDGFLYDLIHGTSEQFALDELAFAFDTSTETA
jgi:hypothetical protein